MAARDLGRALAPLERATEGFLRRGDRESARAAIDPAWHDLARDLPATQVRVRGQLRERVHVVEFGAPALLVDGRRVRPRLGKAVELLAYLAVAEGPRERARDRVLEELFGDPSDESARAYLRQALAQLRRALPGTPPLLGDDEPFGPLLDVTTDSMRFEAELDAAAGLDRIEAALDRLAAGAYLPLARSPWAEARRRHLADRAADARFLAAGAALRLGRPGLARAHNDAVLAADPFREAAWAQRMRIAAALGDGDAVLAAFGACREALAALNRSPAAETIALLGALRR